MPLLIFVATCVSALFRVCVCVLFRVMGYLWLFCFVRVCVCALFRVTGYLWLPVSVLCFGFVSVIISDYADVKENTKPPFIVKATLTIPVKEHTYNTAS